MSASTNASYPDQSPHNSRNLPGVASPSLSISANVASAFGAFVFGAGMQLGGGCASGTLFTVGGGS